MNLKFKSIFNNILENHLILAIFIVFCTGLSLMTTNFLSAENIFNILRQSSIIGIIAVGTTFVIIGAGFDISVGSVLALCGSLTLGLQYSMHWTLVCVFVLVVGSIIGLFNGILSVTIGIPSIIVTLAMMSVVRGMVYLYSDGYPFTLVEGASEGFTFIGQGNVGVIPFPVILLFIVIIAGQWFLVKTRHGRYICAIGGNKEAARYSGISVGKYQILTFVIGGALAAIAGIVYASRLLSVSPLAGQGYELDAIAAVVIGGTSVSGGQGSIFKTLIGVLLLAVIGNTFNLMGIPVYSQLIIKGVIILVAVGLDSYVRKRP
jgi:ribose transport system permease protein